jgi:hypothetical protein
MEWFRGEAGCVTGTVLAFISFSWDNYFAVFRFYSDDIASFAYVGELRLPYFFSQALPLGTGLRRWALGPRLGKTERGFVFLGLGLLAVSEVSIASSPILGAVTFCSPMSYQSSQKHSKKRSLAVIGLL